MIILIDNYDSFTWNIVHYLKELGADIEVVRNDQVTLDQLWQLDPQAFVISPGPCDPDRSGICLDLIVDNARREKPAPCLGICLGHQAIGQSFGGDVIRAPAPMHGKVSHIHHQGSNILADLPDPFEATRYHSLIVDRKTLPDCLDVTAWSSDDLIMGIAHKTLPFYGVQFHPESIATKHGHAILKNFLTLI